MVVPLFFGLCAALYMEPCGPVCARALRGLSVRPSRFSVVVLEAAGYPNDGGRLDHTIEPLLLRAGFRRERRLEYGARGAWNPAYVHPQRISAECIGCGADAHCLKRALAGARPKRGARHQAAA